MNCVITALLCVTSANNPNTVISSPTEFDSDNNLFDFILHYYAKEYIGMCSLQGLNYLQLNRGTSPISGVFNTQDTNALNISEVSKILPNITCPIVLDRYTFLDKFNMFMSSIKVDDASWECLLLAEFVCDGRAQCLTDECGCGSDVFFCATQPGCIPFSQLCDGTADCRDQSDECLCQGFVRMHCPGTVENIQICVSQLSYCYDELYHRNNCIIDEPIDCRSLKTMSEIETPLSLCSYHLSEVIRLNAWTWWNLSMQAGLINDSENVCSDFPAYRANEWANYFKFMIFVKSEFMTTPMINCDYQKTLTFEERVISTKIPIIMVCDGKIDCKSMVDEQFCPGRFYCDPDNTSALWINSSSRCNHIKDCSNGRDECVGCHFGSITSDEMLLRSVPIVIASTVVCLAVIGLNISQCFKTWSSSHQNKVSQVDRILRLQVLFYDCLMGVYLGSIIMATLIIRIKHGTYCMFDNWWRSSIYCDVLGILFSISSHGSLMVVSLMSLLRCLQCCIVFVDVSKRAVVVSSVFIVCIIVINAVVPVLRAPAIQAIFRSAIFLENPRADPFRDPTLDSSLGHVERLHHLYYPRKPIHNVYDLLRNVRNITTKPEIFDYSEKTYYGSNRLCVQNIFKNQVSDVITSRHRISQQFWKARPWYFIPPINFFFIISFRLGRSRLESSFLITKYCNSIVKMKGKRSNLV